MCLLQSYLLGHLPPPPTAVLGLVLLSSSESRSSSAFLLLLLLPCTVFCARAFAFEDDAGLVSSVFFVAVMTRDRSDDDAGVDSDADPGPMVKGFLAWASQSPLFPATPRYLSTEAMPHRCTSLYARDRGPEEPLHCLYLDKICCAVCSWRGYGLLVSRVGRNMHVGVIEFQGWLVVMRRSQQVPSCLGKAPGAKWFEACPLDPLGKKQRPEPVGPARQPMIMAVTSCLMSPFVQHQHPMLVPTCTCNGTLVYQSVARLVRSPRP